MLHSAVIRHGERLKVCAQPDTTRLCHHHCCSQTAQNLQLQLLTRLKACQFVCRIQQRNSSAPSTGAVWHLRKGIYRRQVNICMQHSRCLFPAAVPDTCKRPSSTNKAYLAEGQACISNSCASAMPIAVTYSSIHSDAHLCLSQCVHVLCTRLPMYCLYSSS